MFTKRILLFAVAVALFSSAVGCCHHRCWKDSAVSYAPPPPPPCDTCR